MVHRTAGFRFAIVTVSHSNKGKRGPECLSALAVRDVQLLLESVDSKSNRFPGSFLDVRSQECLRSALKALVQVQLIFIVW